MPGVHVESHLAEESVIVCVDDGKACVPVSPSFVRSADPLHGLRLSESVLHESEAQDGRISASSSHRRRIVNLERAQSYLLCLQPGVRWNPLQASSVTHARTRRWPNHLGASSPITGRGWRQFRNRMRSRSVALCWVRLWVWVDRTVTVLDRSPNFRSWPRFRTVRVTFHGI